MLSGTAPVKDIDFREMKDPLRMPFESGQFDLVINRHGDYDNCLEQLIKAQEILGKNGVIEGTIHRYLIVCRK